MRARLSLVYSVLAFGVLMGQAFKIRGTSR